jgi:hypothetical protein
MTCGCNALVGIEMPTDRVDASSAPQVPASDASRSRVPTDAAADSICPAAMPVANEACSRVELVCQYKDDPRGDVCRDTATCSDTGWLTTRHVCPDLPPTTCPATRAAAQGTACSPLFAWCSYDQGLACECTNCPTGMPFDECSGALTWHCQEPNPNPLCPITLPNAGTLCTTDGISCLYHCGANGVRECKDGLWLRADAAKCPQVPPGG